MHFGGAEGASGLHPQGAHPDHVVLPDIFEQALVPLCRRVWHDPISRWPEWPQDVSLTGNCGMSGA
ncbi:hypothetical protein [Roseovarius sp.]|uniref:hypothetical protein n=1 Tax=Roseovarius sp. TaxID=1486281 RepID=UPI0035688880